jgi:hypothetical protein
MLDVGFWMLVVSALGSRAGAGIFGQHPKSDI